MLESHERNIVILGLDGYSAKGIARLMWRVHKEKISHSQIYSRLKKNNVKLRDVRNAETEVSEARGMKLVAPKMKVRRAS